VAERNIFTLRLEDMKRRVSKVYPRVMAKELKRAIKTNELAVYYQPKVDTVTGKVVGAEALIRWRHPNRGLIMPDQFIPVAEKAGIIIEIGKWMMLEVCRQNKSWQDKGYSKYRISVNISALEFHQSNLVEEIKQVLKKSGLEAKYLEIELTESKAVIEEDQTIDKMKEIKALGVKLALDDFGTGYSALGYLKVLPIDILKLDKSFITELEKDTIGRDITASIIRLADILDIGVIAEGVETRAQIDLLAAMGCHIVQGYYYGIPLPAHCFEELYLKEL
jgi:EAL domain-containing protein (putative c-di-GMP-specific phosphodiesterase class I)